MNLKKIEALDCDTRDLKWLLDRADFGDLNLPFRIDHDVDEEDDYYVWISECEYVGNLSTNNLECAGEQTLLVVTLLKLLQQGRLKVVKKT